MDDLISRQAAIDALRASTQKYTGFMEMEMYTDDDAVEAIINLPSAQPEPIKINIEDFNKEDLERLKKEWENTPITVLPAQPEIVRCKDCKHWDKTWTNDWSPDYHYCPMIDGVRKGDFYCADAERRTDE